MFLALTAEADGVSLEEVAARGKKDLLFRLALDEMKKKAKPKAA